MKNFKTITVLLGCLILTSCGAKQNGNVDPKKIEGKEITIDEADKISKQITEKSALIQEKGYKLVFHETETVKQEDNTTSTNITNWTFLFAKNGDVGFNADITWHDGDKEYASFYKVKDSKHEEIGCTYAKTIYAEDKSVEEEWKVYSKKDTPAEYKEFMGEADHYLSQGGDTIESGVERVADLKESFEKEVANYESKGYKVDYKFYSSGDGSLCLDCTTTLVDRSKIAYPQAENMVTSHEILKFDNYALRSVYSLGSSDKNRTTEFTATITCGDQKVSLPSGWEKHLAKSSALPGEKAYTVEAFQALLNERKPSFTVRKATATAIKYGSQQTTTLTYDEANEKWIDDSTSETTDMDVESDLINSLGTAALLGVSIDQFIKCYATDNSYRITGSYKLSSGSKAEFEYKYRQDGLRFYLYQKNTDASGTVVETTINYSYSE